MVGERVGDSVGASVGANVGKRVGEDILQRSQPDDVDVIDDCLVAKYPVVLVASERCALM